MSTTSETFHIIGIDVRTSNQNGQAGQDIPNLWQKFMSENIAGKISNKISEEVFCIYTEYEGDHNKPYTTLLGCKVDSLENIPESMRGMTFTTKNQKAFQAKGNLLQGAIWQKWAEIWETDLDRTYTFDYEVYGEKAQNPEDAEVVIFVAVK